MEFESELIRLEPWTVREFRGGEGTPVALIHGLSGSFRWWSRNREFLASRHEVAGIDLIGFGSARRFTGSPLPLELEESTMLLARWIGRRFEEPVHVVGHSMGGQLAIHLAAEHPKLVRSLVLVSSSGVPIDLRPGQHLGPMFHPPGSLLSFLPVLLTDAFRAGPSSIALALSRLIRDDVRPLLGAIRVPTLLVWGENDPIIPLRYARTFDSEISSSNLVVLARAGHIPMWDRPEEFNETVTRFLQEIERGRVAPPAEPRFHWALQGCDDGICFRA
ncbi:MAG: alpha/beta fold hydrolase, partial [Thermoanaerobaculia bacterium]|nr:alpha/beta fold hydrolase [Thermoanaerobaculia bacterium]